MARLVDDVHQRRPGVGARRPAAVASRAAVIEEPFALGQLRRAPARGRPERAAGRHFARRRAAPAAPRARPSGDTHESCMASRSLASTMMLRTRSFSAGTSAGREAGGLDRLEHFDGGGGAAEAPVMFRQRVAGAVERQREDRHARIDRETERAVLERQQLGRGRSGAFGEDHHRHPAATGPRGSGPWPRPRWGRSPASPARRRRAASAIPCTGIRNSSALDSHFISQGRWLMSRMSAKDS